MHAALSKEMFRALYEPAHHSDKATLGRMAQRFWWPCVRAHVSAFGMSFEVCDRDRNANLLPHTPLSHHPANQLFGTLY